MPFPWARRPTGTRVQKGAGGWNVACRAVALPSFAEKAIVLRAHAGVASGFQPGQREQKSRAVEMERWRLPNRRRKKRWAKLDFMWNVFSFIFWVYILFGSLMVSRMYSGFLAVIRISNAFLKHLSRHCWFAILLLYCFHICKNWLNCLKVLITDRMEIFQWNNYLRNICE